MIDQFIRIVFAIRATKLTSRVPRAGVESAGIAEWHEYALWCAGADQGHPTEQAYQPAVMNEISHKPEESRWVKKATNYFSFPRAWHRLVRRERRFRFRWH